MLFYCLALVACSGTGGNGWTYNIPRRRWRGKDGIMDKGKTGGSAWRTREGLCFAKAGNDSDPDNTTLKKPVWINTALLFIRALHYGPCLCAFYQPKENDERMDAC